jgi:L-fucose isomerase-like protein
MLQFRLTRTLLDSIKTTGCLGLALLNANDSIGTCEGDIPAMLSMYILKQVVGQPGFQANPSRIDVDKNELVFAHCTLPLNMAQSIKVMTHYESGIGVAFQGHLKEQPITIFKLSRNLKDYYAEEGHIVENLSEENLCRTQIKVTLKDTSYFLKHPYGNHHIIVYGHHKKALDTYMNQL